MAAVSLNPKPPTVNHGRAWQRVRSLGRPATADHDASIVPATDI